jgi:leucyl aminopeptidase
MTGYTAGYISHNITLVSGIIIENIDTSLKIFRRRIKVYSDAEASFPEYGLL